MEIWRRSRNYSTSRLKLGRAIYGNCPPTSRAKPAPSDYGRHDIEIIAEINHCPRLKLPEISQDCRDSTVKMVPIGSTSVASRADLGPEFPKWCRHCATTGHRVSIDSLDPARNRARGSRRCAGLVLSVNSSNREAAVDWGAEVIAIPDDPKTLAGLDETVDFLAKAGVPLRIDPILEPIAFGFAQSLGRYLEIRRRYPDAEMMMGIGNLTELTDVDSAGVNALLLGFCQEVGIRSVLTTQVINWARTSVSECHFGRQLVYHAVNHRVPPKHLESNLLMLRDEQIVEKVGP